MEIHEIFSCLLTTKVIIFLSMLSCINGRASANLSLLANETLKLLLKKWKPYCSICGVNSRYYELFFSYLCVSVELWHRELFHYTFIEIWQENGSLVGATLIWGFPKLQGSNGWNGWFQCPWDKANPRHFCPKSRVDSEDSKAIW